VGNGLIVTFKTGAEGTVWVSGFGLRKKHEQLSPGTHRIRVGFTKLGIRRHKHHKPTSMRVKLVAGQQAVTSSMTVRL
jgi:hypothetical protein